MKIFISTNQLIKIHLKQLQIQFNILKDVPKQPCAKLCHTVLRKTRHVFSDRGEKVRALGYKNFGLNNHCIILAVFKSE